MGNVTEFDELIKWLDDNPPTEKPKSRTATELLDENKRLHELRQAADALEKALIATKDIAP